MHNLKIGADLYRSNSNRLKDFDYSNNNAYFITICSHNREELFGEIQNGEMRLNDVGRMVERWWEWLEIQYEYIILDQYVIMLNHLHGILQIASQEGVSRNAPSNEERIDKCRGGSRTAQKIKPLGQIIGAFKTVSAKEFNQINQTIHKLWQRNYYDHIIRNEKELNNIRTYIQNNPLKWDIDIENKRINKKIDTVKQYKSLYES